MRKAMAWILTIALLFLALPDLHAAESAPQLQSAGEQTEASASSSHDSSSTKDSTRKKTRKGAKTPGSKDDEEADQDDQPTGSSASQDPTSESTANPPAEEAPSSPEEEPKQSDTVTPDESPEGSDAAQEVSNPREDAPANASQEPTPSPDKGDAATEATSSTDAASKDIELEAAKAAEEAERARAEEAAKASETKAAEARAAEAKTAREAEEEQATKEAEKLAKQADRNTKTQKDAKTKPSSQDVGIESQASTTPHVSYRTHVQTIGWQGWVRDGSTSGTSGQSKRLEGIRIQLEKPPYSGGIEYRTHVQTYGWQGWVSNGAMSGTEGQSKRLEAIQVRLTGTMAQKYDVWYRVHAQTFGWMGWTKNGSHAGTATYAKRLEAIQIRILPKGHAAPGSTARPYATRLLRYRTHVQTFGWQGWSFDGGASGTTGMAKRLEGINISLADAPYSGGIEYRTHVQTYGWQGWVSNGAMSGTEGQSKRLEAIQVRLTGTMAQKYDVWYRVHAQTFGWMGWTSNGGQAGTAGYSKRLEAIQIVLVNKGSGKPSTSLGGVQQNTSTAFRSNPSPGSPASQPSSSGTPTSRGPKSAGALRVKDSQLVAKDGKPIQLKGISTHGLAWYPDYVNDACFKQLRNQWNANVVRLAMYTEEYGGYCSGGDRAYLTELVKKGVRLATSNDLYVIVDWHILSDGNPNTHVAEAKAFFRDMSATFRGNTNVLYEICNEPNGGTSWSSIKSYANQVIPVIRANDPDAVVIVGTPTWSQEVDKAAQSKLSQGNVMYALHFYAATHKDDLRNRMASAVKGGLPVFVSEFGICDASGNGSIDQASANSWITTMNSLNVSWCMWSLCNKAESASAIKSSCGATSGFKSGDLSTSGTWLLKALNGSLPAGHDASRDATPSTQTQPSSSGQKPKPVTFTTGGLTCKATLTSSWSAGNGKTCYQYDLSITNKGNARSSWTVTVPFNKAISYTNGWNGSYKASGSTLTIRNASYNGTLAKGATITGIGFQVTAGSGLSVKGSS